MGEISKTCFLSDCTLMNGCPGRHMINYIFEDNDFRVDNPYINIITITLSDKLKEITYADTVDRYYVSLRKTYIRLIYPPNARVALQSTRCSTPTICRLQSANVDPT